MMVRLRSLGQCVIEMNGSRLRPDAEVLFGCGLYLALERARRVERAELQALFWPEAPEERGAHCLRQAIYKLRALGAPVESDRAQVVLPAAVVELDFAPLLEIRDAGEAREPHHLDALLHAAPGEFLPGYAPAFSERFTDWVERQRDLVNGALRRLLVAGILARRTAGDWPGVEALAHRCLSLDALNEEATLALAEAAAMHGDKARALGILDGYLREIGPRAREIRLPAQLLRRRVAEAGAAPLRRAGVPTPPFVGRSGEMGTLHRALHGAMEGRGSGYLISGEPGIGKTRLTAEFTRAAELHRAQVVRVRCQSHDERHPLSAFSELAVHLLDMPGALGCSPESMTHLNRLLRRDPQLPPPLDAQEAKAIFAQVCHALLDLLDAVAGERCTIVLIEDVHWLDPLSWELLAEVVPWLETRQLLLLLTSRNADAAQRRGVVEVPELHEMPLRALDAAAGAELLRQVLAASERVVGPGFGEWCLHASAGNPYFLFELTLHALEGADGYQVPPSLQHLVAERLRRLRAATRRALQAIAILGRHSTLERLEAVLEQRRVDLLDCLDELDAHGLLLADGALVMSRHQLFAQGVLAQLSASSRGVLHRHAARLMEGETATAASTSVLWACAEHWHLAGETPRALEVLRTCARQVIEMGAPLEAARTLEQARRLAPAADPVGIELGCAQAQALKLGGQWHQLDLLLADVHRQRMEADPDGEQHTEEELLWLETRWRRGEDLTAPLAQLIECASDPAAPAEHRLDAALFAMMHAANLCTRDLGIVLWQRVGRLIANESLDVRRRKHIALVYHAAFGDRREAVTVAAELIKVATATGSRAALCRILRHAAIAHEYAGQFDEAVSLAAESFRVAEKAGMGGDAYVAASFLALHWLDWEQFSKARLWRHRAAEWAQQIEDPTALAQVTAIDTRLAMGDGDWKEAERLAHYDAELWTGGHQPRRDAVMLADIVRATLRAGGRPKREAMSALHQLYEIVRAGQGVDTIAAALYEGLVALGEEAEAKRVVAEYMTQYRGEIGEPPPAYRTVLQYQPVLHPLPSRGEP